MTNYNEPAKKTLKVLEIEYKGYENFKDNIKISSSKTAYNLLNSHWSQIELKEKFKLICLTQSNKVMGISTICIGELKGCIVDIKSIMSTALLSNAAAIIVAHNHPSGSLQPSQADLNTTKKLKEACKCMDISLLDHLILTPDCYTSMADNGDI